MEFVPMEAELSELPEEALEAVKAVPPIEPPASRVPAVEPPAVAAPGTDAEIDDWLADGTQPPGDGEQPDKVGEVIPFRRGKDVRERDKDPAAASPPAAVVRAPRVSGVTPAVAGVIDQAATEAAARQGTTDPSAASIDIKDEAFFASDYEPDPYDDYDLGAEHGGKGKWVFLGMVGLVIVVAGVGYHYVRSSPYYGDGPANLQLKNRPPKAASASAQVAGEDAGRVSANAGVDAAATAQPSADSGVAEVAADAGAAAVAAVAKDAAATVAMAKDAAAAVKPAGADASAPVAGGDEYAQLVAEAKALLAKGRSGPAGRIFAKALKANPDGWEALEAVALVEMERGRMKQAEKLARQALGHTADAAKAHLVVGMVLVEQGKKGDAKASFERYLKLCPDCKNAKEIRAYLKSL